jgi:phage terminase large subunit-like protein
MIAVPLERVRFPGDYSPWDTRGDCEFDPDCAANAIRFFAEKLRHVKGEKAGKPLILKDWQANIIGTLFGWKRPDKTRRYRTAYVEVPRKAGKSTLASGIALLLLYCDDEPGAEIYSCASDRDQAAIVFEIAKENVVRCPALSKRSQIYQRSIVHRDVATGIPRGSYKVISAEAASKHGYNPSGIIFDELHAQPNRDLWDVMKTGTGARSQPLTVALTTAGYDRHSICWEVRQQAVSVREGHKHNESMLPVIYGAEPDDDWQLEATWRKAQPNLGVSVPESFYRDECTNAKQSPAFENTFRRLYLNQWTEQAVRWLPMDAWRKCAGEFDPTGLPCYAGLDLSTTTDLSALVLAFRMPDGGVYIEPHFWAPRENARRRSRVDGVPYEDWARDGFLTLTDADEGKVVDYGRIKREILELREKYDIQEIAIDRWNATQLAMELSGEGFVVSPHGQGYASMSGPSKEFEKLVFGGTLRHPKNPVLDWMAGNVAVEQDAAGNLKPSKKVSTERIDGIVAAVMAVGRLVSEEVQTGPLFFTNATT